MAIRPTVIRCEPEDKAVTCEFVTIALLAGWQPPGGVIVMDRDREPVAWPEESEDD